MRQRRPIAYDRLGHDIGEVRAVTDSGVRLDHRRLREAVEHDQVVRLRRARARTRLAHEQQVDRLRDLDLARDVQHRTVVEEGGVHRRERLRLVRGHLAEVLLDEERQLVEGTLQRHEGHSLGQPGGARERRIVAAVHEHERVPVRRAERERRELRRRHIVRRGREEVELALGDRRHRGEVPVLVLRGRETQRLEPRDR